MNNLVSIGLPVKNGEAFLPEAIELLINQTYSNIEIIASDNNSSDKSLNILKYYQVADCRMKIYEHKCDLTALENFKYTLMNSLGNFFMWAACDDRRDLNFIEELLYKMNEEASLIFSNVSIIPDHFSWTKYQNISYEFQSNGLSTISDILKKYATFNCLHIYGLIRKEYLIDYDWYEIEYGPDIPLLMHLITKGQFLKTSNTRFYYYQKEKLKNSKERAYENFMTKLAPFPEIRLAYTAAKAIKRNRNNASLIYIILLFYYERKIQVVKSKIYKYMPFKMRNIYHILKRNIQVYKNKTKLYK